MDEDQVREASWTVQVTTGLSAYFYGVGYSHEKFEQELERIVEHIRQSAG